MTRKEIHSEIKRRVACGESKSSIFSHYEMTEWEDAAARILAVQVTLANRRKWRFLNWLLIACLSVITLFKVIDTVAVVSTLNNASVGVLIVLLGLAVNIALLVAVIRYVGLAYLITAALLFQGVPKIMQAAGKLHFALDVGLFIFWSNATFVATGIVLALVLHRLMLPCTTFFLTPRKTAMGRPIFED